MIVHNNHLQKVVELLQKRIKPEAIYLFGSQVSGKALEQSGDVDLCIIVADDREPYRETVHAYESLQEMPFPKDIIVRRKSRFNERADWPYTLENEVRKTGRRIFPA